MYYEIGDAGTPLVLISPLSGDHLAWGLQVPDFTAAGFRCLTFDNRDAGQTGASPEDSYSMRQFADDTAAVMTAAGVTAAHVMGASMGGMIAQELALNHPQRVLSLTLVCTSAWCDPALGSVLAQWKALRPHCTPDEFLRVFSPWLFTYRFFAQPEPLAGLLEMARGNPFPQAAAWYGRQTDAILGHDTRGRLHALAVPAHVIVGEEDVLTPPRLSRDLAAAISGATLTELPACGHGLFWEQTAAFNAAVIGFLRGQATA